ncbi:MAG TPA: taurine dioxygenase [Rhodospirillaceae bacterium]|nr:taurine dioxygenase [Rhodospirillaceae bacterium]
MAGAEAIEVIPTGKACGAEIRGVDLAKPIDDVTFGQIHTAFAEHGIIFFRDQDVSGPTQVEFSKRFGELDIYVLAEYTLDDAPEILLISNIQENGRNIGLADAGTTWHTDTSYIECPPLATFLNARELPIKDGVVLGDTIFSSAAAAYDDLDPAFQRRIDSLTAIHSYYGKHAARAKLGRSNRVEPSDEEDKSLQPVEHPVVRRHPINGKKSIYVSAGECISIPGMADEAALDLIDTLAARIIDPKYHYRHNWQPGDFVIWDNCQLQHLAMRDYELPLRRLMYRTQVKGPRPT